MRVPPVFWVVLILLSILALTVSQRGPVRTAGTVILVAGLAVVLTLRLLRPNDALPTRSKSVSPAAVVATVDLQQVSISDLVLSGGGAPFELRGRISNTSQDMQLSTLTLGLKRRDCYAGSLDPQGCETLWEDQHWMPLTVPAGESRDFATVIWAHNSIPRAHGTVRDEIVVVAATGQPSDK